jgi:hypothetical protein
MRERSHKKGETYQRAAKHWLAQTTFLGFGTELFGDAYDVTKDACTIGGVVFDFSLTLRRGEVARFILYGECKYRDERRGDVDGEFRSFLDHVRSAVAQAKSDSRDNAVFLFVSNIPPGKWRDFLRNRRKFCSRLWKSDPAPDIVLDKIAKAVHVVVLSEGIIEGS